jgi:hypothetical protein
MEIVTLGNDVPVAHGYARALERWDDLDDGTKSGISVRDGDGHHLHWMFAGDD